MATKNSHKFFAAKFGWQEHVEIGILGPTGFAGKFAKKIAPRSQLLNKILHISRDFIIIKWIIHSIQIEDNKQRSYEKNNGHMKKINPENKISLVHYIWSKLMQYTKTIPLI